MKKILSLIIAIIFFYRQAFPQMLGFSPFLAPYTIDVKFLGDKYGQGDGGIDHK
jgi:hypothetical protein